MTAAGRSSKWTRPIGSFDRLEEFGRVRLSDNFFMRDFLHSEIANFYGLRNIPDDPAWAIEVGERLCQELLEPINATFGRIAIRSAYRSCEVNALGNAKGHNCASNENNFGHHIWDRPDAKTGAKGATACIVVPWFADRYEAGADWRAMAWWVHDHLPYSSLCFFKHRAAFNIQWSEQPERRISSFVPNYGVLTKPGMVGHDDDHADLYSDFPTLDSKGG